MWEPRPRKSISGARSPLADGAHDAVGSLALVEPCVVAVPHQLIGFRLMTPHVLVEVSEVHVGELLQTQHACAGEAPSSVPVRPMWSKHSGRQHLPTYPKGSGSPWPQALGATCPHLDSGQMNLVSVTSGPEGRPREVCFLFKP